MEGAISSNSVTVELASSHSVEVLSRLAETEKDLNYGGSGYVAIISAGNVELYTLNRP